jgi:hypothetical protein
MASMVQKSSMSTTSGGGVVESQQVVVTQTSSEVRTAARSEAEAAVGQGQKNAVVRGNGEWNVRGNGMEMEESSAEREARFLAELKAQVAEAEFKLERQSQMHHDALGQQMQEAEIEKKAFRLQLSVLQEKFEASTTATETVQTITITEQEESTSGEHSDIVNKKLEEVRLRQEKVIALKTEELETIRRETQKIVETKTRILDDIVKQKHELETLASVNKIKLLEDLDKERKISESFTEKFKNVNHHSTAASIRWQAEQEEAAVKAVYWEHFSSIRDELARANHMTLSLDMRYQQLVKDYATALQDHVLCLWQDSMINAHVEARADVMGHMKLGKVESDRVIEEEIQHRLAVAKVSSVSSFSESSSSFQMTGTDAKIAELAKIEEKLLASSGKDSKQLEETEQLLMQQIIGK